MHLFRADKTTSLTPEKQAPRTSKLNDLKVRCVNLECEWSSSFANNYTMDHFHSVWGWNAFRTTNFKSPRIGLGRYTNEWLTGRDEGSVLTPGNRNSDMKDLIKFKLHDSLLRCDVEMNGKVGEFFGGSERRRMTAAAASAESSSESKRQTRGRTLWRGASGPNCN